MSYHYAADGTPRHPLSECRPGVCWTDEPIGRPSKRHRQEEIVETEGGRRFDAENACKDYEGGRGYGEYLDGNPCAHCRFPEKAHSDEARKRWKTLWATMTF